MAKPRSSQSSNQPGSSNGNGTGTRTLSVSSNSNGSRTRAQSGSTDSHGSRYSARIAAAQSQRSQKRKSSPSVDRGAVKANKINKKNETASTSSKRDKSIDEVDWQLGKSVTESISIAQTCDAWSDVSFRFHDQDETDEPVKAHKFILASRSPVFEAMFFGLMKETNQVIKLEDVSSDTFRAFLRFLYTDDVDLNFQVAEELVYTAHKYRVTKCVEICSNFLLDNINDDNALKYLQIATLLDLSDLEAAAIKHIQKLTLLVFQSEEFLSISRDTLKVILKDDNLNISSEAVVFKYVDKWAAQRCKEMKKKVTGPNKRVVLGEEIFSLIRFRTMTAKDFVRCLLEKEYFDLREYEAILVEITGLGEMLPSAYSGRQRGVEPPEDTLKKLLENDPLSKFLGRCSGNCGGECGCLTFV